MAQYISKSAVVAEIEKRLQETESMQPKFDQFWAGQISAFKGVLKILDTLEVKEINPNDAFIEKAAEWLDKTLRDTDFYEDEIELFIKDFKKAMKL